jgi:ADP-ribosylglycohydrolase
LVKRFGRKIFRPGFLLLLKDVGINAEIKDDVTGISDTERSLNKLREAALNGKTSVDDLKQALDKAVELTNITHNHPESILATRVYIETMYMAKKGISSPIIKNYITNKYGYDLSMSVDEIRPNYNKFYTSCKNSVPQAVICALDANSYEDAIRNAVSLGGDSDTLACMAGGIAEARFGVPDTIKKQAAKYMDANVSSTIAKLYQNLR